MRKLKKIHMQYGRKKHRMELCSDVSNQHPISGKTGAALKVIITSFPSTIDRITIKIDIFPSEMGEIPI